MRNFVPVHMFRQCFFASNLLFAVERQRVREVCDGVLSVLPARASQLVKWFINIQTEASINHLVMCVSESLRLRGDQLNVV